MSEYPRLVTHTTEPLPPLVDTPAALTRTCALISAASGPVALDTERAGSFRYSQGAYLVQIRREGAGTFLIDPTSFTDLSCLNDSIGKGEWLLHSATQDMPWLAQLGMRPQLLFDTEIAAQLLNLQRFGLASVTEQILGVRLAKKYSAVDWSTRPLPTDWLQYAALDVEFLIPLRERMWVMLQEQSKDDWAEQEFDYLLKFKVASEKPEPWRRLPGSGKIRTALNLAALRELWYARDRVASKEDLAPTKVLSNAAMISLAAALPKGKRYMFALDDFRHDRSGRSRADVWYAALSRSYKLPKSEWPDRGVGLKSNEIPDSRNFSRNHPKESERWHRLREAVAITAKEISVTTEVLLEPRILRRLAWVLPDNSAESQVLEVLQDYEARPWQIEHTLPILTRALHK